ncbi:preprotein translocase subunit SecA [Candidatus Gottesmanbacteria bacterium RIFCSPHIGHO2_01_FULL_42_12]|uniref:Protein translocase subunit SecA n=1 Tax=Candidatus Gottesmanbacteria bacterium RIFCSPHIGHO2_01_FULL_42_12 TaxID=1798377 RepID=A0A1F5Z034_9BACT|nr:MAG: preprotein translocase subunit SecA [Candidatus Gottesmanbacteria bacterium RIFCSPHIGHO2_01_FULL_42_12]
MNNLFSKFFDANASEVSRFAKIVAQINALEPEIKKLKDSDFPRETESLKKTPDVVRAFALAREASFRVNKERPFDVQLIGSLALNEGKIAEQKTGEGKTLTAAMPLYFNALGGKGVHLVTVNDYLVKVGVGWMGPIYHFLGLSCAGIIHEKSFIYDVEFEDNDAQDWRLRHLRPVSRKEAYAADITYGINSEFGFDYLRDNMTQKVEDLVQRNFTFAIVDEVDSVLIDEARTPHIISAPQAEPIQKYYEYAAVVEKLTPKLDYIIDEKLRTTHLTDHGISKIESLLGVKDVYEKDFATVHHVEAALKARALYQREKDYIVKDGEIVIVDEFTGRLMAGRRWSEGIHQAIEAKENVPIQQESKTLATISLQNYFRKYEKLAGMTGTAATEAEEFHKIYKLDVIVIPTNRPNVRKDFSDQVYKTQRAKYAAIVADVEDCYKRGQPVLVGTTSIEKNEIVSQFLRHRNIPHQVLNAKYHEKEASIIAMAGTKGAVTVATNMAGRGVDIILGGPKEETKEWDKRHSEVVLAGGLHVIGTERHESRRIDNQLRGRAGRQGDPGSSRFYVALDDDIMRIFGGDQVAKLMTMFNIPENQPLEHSLVTRSIEQAQKKVEGLNFDSRKNLVEYDDIMNKQREIIYSMRRKVFDNVRDKDEIMAKVDRDIETLTGLYDNPEKIIEEFSSIIPFDQESQKRLVANFATTDLRQVAHETYEAREKQMGENVMKDIERYVMLSVVDNLWMDHLDAIDDLRSGIGLRGYAQRDPLTEYKAEAFNMFEKLIGAIDDEIVHRIFKVQVNIPPQPAVKIDKVITNAKQLESLQPNPTTSTVPTGTSRGKPGRNDPCWCGKMKPDGIPVKYKHCHYPN